MELSPIVGSVLFVMLLIALALLENSCKAQQDTAARQQLINERAQMAELIQREMRKQTQMIAQQQALQKNLNQQQAEIVITQK